MTTEASPDWLKWVAELPGRLTDHPEQTTGPDGERYSVGYSQDALRGGAPFALVGLYETPIAFDIAPGVTVLLTKCRVYLD